MEKKFVGIGDVFYVEQLHVRVFLSIEVLIHILKNIFYANLLAIANAPHTVEL